MIQSSSEVQHVTVPSHGFYYLDTTQENTTFNSIFIYRVKSSIFPTIYIGRSLHTTNLPDEVLQEVFEYVRFNGGDAAIATLNLICSRWSALVGDDIFRRRAHFRWLSTVHDWEKASPEFSEQYYVMYDMYECLGCQRESINTSKNPTFTS